MTQELGYFTIRSHSNKNLRIGRSLETADAVFDAERNDAFVNVFNEEVVKELIGPYLEDVTYKRDSSPYSMY